MVVSVSLPFLSGPNKLRTPEPPNPQSVPPGCRLPSQSIEMDGTLWSERHAFACREDGVPSEI